jgi:Ca-activated chloride channel family protein
MPNHIAFRKILITMGIIMVLPISCSLVYGQEYEQKPPDKTRILFLLDGSGSMLTEWGPTLKINVAKRFLAQFVDSLRTDPDLELALRVYGHQYHRKYQRCDDSKLEVPFGKDNHTQLIQKLNQVNPQGTTPLAYSLEQAVDDFPEDENARNIIIIITDGIESCDGDPCQVSLKLQKQNIFLKPFIIGIGMEKSFDEQFGCMGQYFDAENIAGFRAALKKSIDQTLEKTTVSVELLDHENKTTISDINITFVNDFTGVAAYDFIHYLDRNGNPDSVEVDAVISYDIKVNTLPAVIEPDPDIIPGQHNIIKIKCPQGTLRISQKNHSEYKKDVEVLIYQQGDDQILKSLNIEETHDFLVGKYDIRITTLPMVEIKGISISPLELNTIEIPPPGILNTKSSFTGIGSLYLLLDNGASEWIYNLPDNQVETSIALQPGNYKLVFRSKNALGSKFSKIKTFTIQSGRTIDLVLN